MSPRERGQYGPLCPGSSHACMGSVSLIWGMRVDRGRARHLSISHAKFHDACFILACFIWSACVVCWGDVPYMPMMPCDMPSCILGAETRHVCLGWCVRAYTSFTSHGELPHGLSCKIMHVECGALLGPPAGNGAHGAHMAMWGVPWVSKGCHDSTPPLASHQMGRIAVHGPLHPHV